nr:hypothetical protein [Tanacetum cinerariifolium]
MSQSPMKPGYFTHLSTLTRNNTRLLRTNRILLPQIHKNSNSFSQLYPPFGTQMPPEQAYQQQLAYHQHQQQVGFQNFVNPRNPPPQYFPQQPSQPQFFSSPSSKQQFEVPQAKNPRDGRRKLKKVSKQPIVNLNEDDDDDVQEKRTNTRWVRDEVIVPAGTWIEHSQKANIKKDQFDDVF